MSTVEVSNLTKRFGELTAVNDVTMQIGAGEVLCLLGPSGCGKTTTLRMIAGLESISGGEVSIAGQRVNEKSPDERNVAMVFQFYALYPTLTVAENLAFPLRAEKLGADAINQRVQSVAKALDILNILDRKPGKLAEGEKQRVAVGRAIVRDPNCFLFDEPLSRLDVTLRETMRGEIKEILSGLSKATVIVTHDQLEALTMADRIAVMRNGAIEQIATPHEIFTRPASLFVAGFIGTPAMNLLPTSVDSYEGDFASYRLGDQRIMVPVNERQRRIPVGSKVTLGIRPRALVLGSEGGADALAADIDLIEPMGAETLAHARAGDLDIRVVVDRKQQVRQNERVWLGCKPGHALLFDEHERLVA